MKLEVDKLYTWSSTLTVAGMASMLWVVLGTLSSAFSWSYPGWFPLLLALVFVVTGDLAQQAAASGKGHKPQSWLARAPLWVINACPVYTTTLGGAHAVLPSAQAQTAAKVNEAVVHASTDPAQATPPPPPAAPPEESSAAPTPGHAHTERSSPADAPSQAKRPSPRPASPDRPTGRLQAPQAARVDVTKLKQALQPSSRVGFTRILDAQLTAAGD